MNCTPVFPVCWKITDAKALDPIHVFWLDVAPGAGYVTIICYGLAWTAYFGAMDGRTIREFFADCDTGYLLSALGIRPMHLKNNKRNEAYLGRIIDAVKEAVKKGLYPE